MKAVSLKKMGILLLCCLFLSFSHSADLNKITKKNIQFEQSSQLDTTIIKKMTGNLNFYRSQVKDPKQSVSVGRQIKDEKNILKKVLNAYGFYNASIEVNIINENSDIYADTSLEQFNDFVQQSDEGEVELFKKRGFRIQYNIELGNVFLIKSIDFNNVLELSKIDTNQLPIQEGYILRAQNILDAFELINEGINEHQCFVDGKLHYDVRIDSKTNSAFVSFDHDQSMQSYFDKVSITGLETIQEAWFIKELGLKKSQCLTKSSINNAVLKLYATNLVAKVNTQIIRRQQDGVQIIELKLNITERKHKTVSIGVGVNTSEGLYISSGWQHRNVFNKGEQININGFIGSYEQSLLGDITLPKTHFFNTSFNASTRLHRENYNEEISIELVNQIGLTKKIDKYTRFKTAIELSNKIQDIDEFQQRLDQVFLPNILTWDIRNDALNTTQGQYVQVGYTPVWDVQHKSFGFIDYQIQGKTFFTIDLSIPITFAFKYEGHYISVNDTNLLPRDERIFLGGGNNLRGFGFQKIDAQGLGGIKSNVFNFESRMRFTDTIGIVTFYDTGQLITEGETFKNSDLYSAVGLGVRYHTSFFPIRFDVAVPVKKYTVDTGKFQFYLSIGQSY